MTQTNEQVVNVVKIENSSASNGVKQVPFEIATLASGTKVAVYQKKLMTRELLIELSKHSTVITDSLYTFTSICNRRGVTLVFPADLKWPQRRKGK